MLLLLDNFCDGKPNGDYKDPDTCHGFISCSNGIPYKMPCPSELCFNEKKDQCDNCKYVPCGKPLFLFIIIATSSTKLASVDYSRSPENKNIRRIVQFFIHTYFPHCDIAYSNVGLK